MPENISDAADKAKDLLDQTTAAAADKAHDLRDKAADVASDLRGKAADKAHDLLDKAADLKDDLRDKAADLKDDLLDKAGDAKKEAISKAKDVRDKAVSTFNGLSTTQKVVGGALLAAGLAYLVAPKAAGKGKRKAAALDELVLFINDRVKGYQRAVAETKDGDLRSYYQQLVDQSQEFAGKLNSYLAKTGSERETGTTLKGKLYRKLMQAQAAVTGHDEKALLAANVYGERWAIKAYKKALRRKALKGDLRTAVQNQLSQSKKTYKKLKELTAKH